MNCRECVHFFGCVERSTLDDDTCRDFQYDDELGEKSDLPCWHCDKTE